MHNDMTPLPNGDILMIAWEFKSSDKALHAGRNPSVNNGSMLIDSIIEVKPTTKGNGTIVWEWHAWDHLIQHYNSSLPNYSIISAHPELIDINIKRTRDNNSEPSDFLHMNSLDYDPIHDQILISCRNINEIMVIDHSTTTAQAAGHSGGKYGKGGDILYRWGNPSNYGINGTQQLFGQHDARWIKPGCPGAGHITIFNNGWGRGYSSAVEIIPPVDANGNYSRQPGQAYGPSSPTWQWVAEDKNEFFSKMMGSVQRLPNGNTLICDGWHSGTIFEVTPDNTIVWNYKNLFPTPVDGFNSIFKAQHYPINYSGIGKTQNQQVIDLIQYSINQDESYQGEDNQSK